jgi:cystathionine beta-lyase
MWSPDVLPAWVANMDFGVAPSITAALARLTRDQEYGYAARDGVLAAAFVRRMERRFGWHTDPADTIAISDLVQASFSSVMAFSEPGDAILLQLPSYPPFTRLRRRSAPLEGHAASGLVGETDCPRATGLNSGRLPD